MPDAPKPAKPDPKILIDCSLDLLAEMHEAYEYFQRARIRSKREATAPHLERLIVQIHQARARSQQKPKKDEADGADAGRVAG